MAADPPRKADCIVGSKQAFRTLNWEASLHSFKFHLCFSTNYICQSQPATSPGKKYEEALGKNLRRGRAPSVEASVQLEHILNFLSQFELIKRQPRNAKKLALDIDIAIAISTAEICPHVADSAPTQQQLHTLSTRGGTVITPTDHSGSTISSTSTTSIVCPQAMSATIPKKSQTRLRTLSHFPT